MGSREHISTASQNIGSESTRASEILTMRPETRMNQSLSHKCWIKPGKILIWRDAELCVHVKCVAKTDFVHPHWWSEISLTFEISVDQHRRNRLRRGVGWSSPAHFELGHKITFVGFACALSSLEEVAVTSMVRHSWFRHAKNAHPFTLMSDWLHLNFRAILVTCLVFRAAKKSFKHTAQCVSTYSTLFTRACWS